MRKLSSILLCIVIVASLLAVPAGAAAPALTGVSSFTVDGDQTIAYSAKGSSAQAVEALEYLVNQATGVQALPADAVKSASIVANFAKGGSSTLEVYHHAEQMYIKQGANAGKVSVTDFNKMVLLLDGELYRYRDIPVASAAYSDNRSVNLYAGESTYAYKRLDGRYYRRVQEEPDEKPMLDISGGKWPGLVFNAETASVAVTVRQGGSTVFTGSWADAGKRILEDPQKEYVVQVQATFASDYYRGSVSYSVTTNPAGTPSGTGNAGAQPTGGIRFEMKGHNTYPGELVLIRAYNVPEGQSINVQSNISFTPQFFKEGTGVKMALFPVSYFNGAGTYPVTVSSGAASQTFQIIVKEKTFQRQDLTVSESTAEETILNQKANEEYEKAIAPLRPVSHSSQYWSGKFVWPVTGPVTTQFGMIRYTNGQPTSSRHGAIDFAVPKGTTVECTGNGRVLYAGYLQLTGNTVLVEHGFGLKSWYYHMDSLNVKTGDTVTQNQKLGEVGSTGFSTGAHLHFGISVNNVFVNPTTVIDTDLLD